MNYYEKVLYTSYTCAAAVSELLVVPDDVWCGKGETDGTPDVIPESLTPSSFSGWYQQSQVSARYQAPGIFFISVLKAA